MRAVPAVPEQRAALRRAPPEWAVVQNVATVVGIPDVPADRSNLVTVANEHGTDQVPLELADPLE